MDQPITLHRREFLKTTTGLLTGLVPREVRWRCSRRDAHGP